MESKAVQSNSRFDLVKWLVVFVLVAAGVVGNQYFGAESLLYRVLALVGLAIVAAFVALQTGRGRRFATLLKEARVEIRKVVWPTRPELVQTTIIVVVFVLVVSLLLWGMDSIISLLVAGFIG
ncbi:MAG: preprotein translocase subunit SecE [Marinobacter sp.]|uniref:preprotein translocase subunit SecE n=1 Tax=Marinobacter sp. TaxID=50741 RepID=UPI003F9479A6